MSCLQVKHPGVLKVIEPLEETSGQMVMVTEPVFGSLANVLSQFREVPTAPQDRVSVTLSPLEAKYGLHTLAETLHFLHHEAHLVHCNINPGETSIIMSMSTSM
jgi:SCY1-like protein 2